VKRAAGAGALAAAAAVALVGIAGATAYGDGPPPGHTGGFGEPTCERCHSGQPINDVDGAVGLSGAPPAYDPGRTYRLTVWLARPALRRAGFQLSARFVNGEHAGHLARLDETTRVTDPSTSPVRYIQHTRTGSDVAVVDTARWTFRWTAPTRPDTVVFHLSANASNDDASEFGDYVYLASRPIHAVTRP
jgi:hypothetical protein